MASPAVNMELTVRRFLGRVPALPRVVVEAERQLRERHADLERVAQLLAKDPGLTARILAIANSPFYGVSREVGRLRDACMVLGIRTLQSVVLSAGVLKVFPADADNSGLYELWVHSAHVAMIARGLAARYGVDAETAFTAGLVHDIGAVGMFSLDAGLAAQAWAEASNPAARMQSERQVFGFDHAEVGSALARHWRYPEEIVRTLAEYHAPGTHQPAMLRDLIHLADVIARGLQYELSADDIFNSLNASVCERLALGREAFHEQCLLKSPRSDEARAFLQQLS